MESAYFTSRCKLSHKHQYTQTSQGLVKGGAHLRDSIGESFIKDVKVKGPQCSHDCSDINCFQPSLKHLHLVDFKIAHFGVYVHPCPNKNNYMFIYQFVSCHLPISETGKINHCNLYKGRRNDVLIC